MDQVTAHQRAQDVFAGVLANVKPEQLGLPSPCSEWDVKAVVDHVIGGNHWVENLVGVESASVPDDLLEAHSQSAAAAQAVFAASDGLTRMFELPFATLPGSAFIGLRTGDVLAHAWDVAAATGQSTDLDPEVAAEALDGAKAMLTPSFRGPGRPFGEEQPCPAGASKADELAAFLGRAVQ